MAAGGNVVDVRKGNIRSHAGGGSVNGDGRVALYDKPARSVTETVHAHHDALPCRIAKHRVIAGGVAEAVAGRGLGHLHAGAAVPRARVLSEEGRVFEPAAIFPMVPVCLAGIVDHRGALQEGYPGAGRNSAIFAIGKGNGRHVVGSQFGPHHPVPGAGVLIAKDWRDFQFRVERFHRNRFAVVDNVIAADQPVCRVEPVFQGRHDVFVSDGRGLSAGPGSYRLRLQVIL